MLITIILYLNILSNYFIDKVIIFYIFNDYTVYIICCLYNNLFADSIIMMKKIYCLLILMMLLLLSCSDKKETDNKNSIKVIEDDEYIKNIIRDSSK